MHALLEERPSPPPAGDQNPDAVFRAFYDEHAPRVYALCLRLTGDETSAGEATQDVFVRAWRTEAYEERGRIRAWLNRIAVNLIQDRARARRRGGWIPLEEAPEVAAPASSATEDRLALERAVARLPERAREVLVLHDIEGFPMHEIADLTGVTAGTVKSQLHRARRLLQEALT